MRREAYWRRRSLRDLLPPQTRMSRFGAKRPDWLRETSRVSAIRNKIKAHLAAQGMIKGHSGSGSRSVIQEDYLRLSEYRDSDNAYPSGSSSSESPHRELSEESDRGYPFTPAAPINQYPMHVHSPEFNYPHPHDGWSPYQHQDYFYFNSYV